MRRKGFTLIELLAVISIIVLLAAVLMPGLAKAKELARRSACKGNISAIGKGIATYNAGNRGQWMWLNANFGSPDSWRWIVTGTNRAISGPHASGSTAFNVTALLFLLVRDGQAPGIFCCPSTNDVGDPNTKYGNTFFWDFTRFSTSNVEHVSYSYQCPDSNHNCSGVTNNSQPGLVVLADRTPAYPGTTTLRVGDFICTPTFNWLSPGYVDLRAGMSQNHSQGEMINFLYADLHVGESIGRADCGINKDNIFSNSGSRDTQQGSGTNMVQGHVSANDSYLIGPYH